MGVRTENLIKLEDDILYSIYLRDYKGGKKILLYQFDLEGDESGFNQAAEAAACINKMYQKSWLRFEGKPYLEQRKIIHPFGNKVVLICFDNIHLRNLGVAHLKQTGII